MAPSPIFLAALVCNAAVIVCHVVIALRIRSHLRSEHPLVWSRFGFPGGTPLIGVDNEGRDVSADMSLREYLRSDEWRKLDDPRLAKLEHTRRITIYAVCLTMLSCIVAFVAGM